MVYSSKPGPAEHSDKHTLRAASRQQAQPGEAATVLSHASNSEASSAPCRTCCCAAATATSCCVAAMVGSSAAPAAGAAGSTSAAVVAGRAAAPGSMPGSEVCDEERGIEAAGAVGRAMEGRFESDGWEEGRGRPGCAAGTAAGAAPTPSQLGSAGAAPGASGKAKEGLRSTPPFPCCACCGGMAWR